jgi:hypothetical protein
MTTGVATYTAQQIAEAVERSFTATDDPAKIWKCVQAALPGGRSTTARVLRHRTRGDCRVARI